MHTSFISKTDKLVESFVLGFVFIILFQFPQNSYGLWNAKKVVDRSQSWRSVVMISVHGPSFCIGTIISETEILTAAHCLTNASKSGAVKITYFDGDDRLHEPVEDFQKMRFDFEYMALHKDYNFGVKDPLKVGQDIGVIKFKKSILPSTDYKPMKFLTGDLLNEKFNGKSFQHLAGYTIGYDDGAAPEERLGFLPIVFQKLIQNNTKAIYRPRDGGSRGACNGDSGAPLTVQDESGELYVFGVIVGAMGTFYKVPNLNIPGVIGSDGEIVCGGPDLIYTIASIDVRRNFIENRYDNDHMIIERFPHLNEVKDIYYIHGSADNCGPRNHCDIFSHPSEDSNRLIAGDPITKWFGHIVNRANGWIKVEIYPSLIPSVFREDKPVYEPNFIGWVKEQAIGKAIPAIHPYVLDNGEKLGIEQLFLGPHTSPVHSQDN